MAKKAKEGGATVEVSEETLKSAIEGLEKQVNTSPPKKYNPKQAKDDQRSKIVTIILVGYLIIIGGSILAILVYNFVVFNTFHNQDLLIQLKDFLLVIGSLIGSPLGFIIGYYFKDESS